MPVTLQMVASEILMCGLKHVPFAGPAFEVLDSIKLKHELVGQADRMAEFEEKLSRFERAQRDLVAQEIRTILDNFQRPGLSGPALTEEIRKRPNGNTPAGRAPRHDSPSATMKID